MRRQARMDIRLLLKYGGIIVVFCVGLTNSFLSQMVVQFVVK